MRLELRPHYDVCKRLSPEEKAEVSSLMQLDPDNLSVGARLQGIIIIYLIIFPAKYGHPYVGSQIRNIKSRCRKRDNSLSALRNFILAFAERGRIQLDLNSEGGIGVLALSTNEMIGVFRKFPEVIQLDGTKHGLILYHLVITDSHLRGQTVFYAFVSEESGDTLKRVIQIFVTFMGATSRVETVVLNKDIKEHNAIRQYLPHVRILLCQWHVTRAVEPQIRKYVSSDKVDYMKTLFRQCIYAESEAAFVAIVDQLIEGNDGFSHYFMKCWYPRRHEWASYFRYHLFIYLTFRLDAVNFDNNTNNRIESANRRLKMWLCARTPLVKALDILMKIKKSAYNERSHQ